MTVPLFDPPSFPLFDRPHLPLFNRPSFVGWAENATSDLGQPRTSILETVEVYEEFLRDQLLPAQRGYAGELESDELLHAAGNWHRGLSAQETDKLLGDFRTVACMNDPTEHALEIIPANPQVLYVYVNTEAVGCVMYQTLDDIPPMFCFNDDSATARMLACEIPPDASNLPLRSAVEKYRSLGCQDVTSTNTTTCLVVPKTSFFRAEGRGFFSRRCLGNFDVLVCIQTSR